MYSSYEMIWAWSSSSKTADPIWLEDWKRTNCVGRFLGLSTQSPCLDQGHALFTVGDRESFFRQGDIASSIVLAVYLKLAKVDSLFELDWRLIYCSLLLSDFSGPLAVCVVHIECRFRSAAIGHNLLRSRLKSILEVLGHFV